MSDDTGEVHFLRPLGDQRFFEPYSGLYWQVSAPGQEVFRSRSLWDRTLGPAPAADCREPCRYASARFAGRAVAGHRPRRPPCPASRRFSISRWRNRRAILKAKIGLVRGILAWSLGGLALSLLGLAALQSTYGLTPLGRVSRSIAAIRSGTARRVGDDFPIEIAPLVAEINELLEHNEKQAEAARRHAGNLAHALKTADEMC